MYRIFLVLALIAAACTSLSTKTVWSDKGGFIEEREREIERLLITKKRVEILGDCFSACTMYLVIPSTCVGPRARLGFHSAYVEYQGEERMSVAGNRQLMRYYPKRVADWVRRTGALTSIDMTYMSAKTAVSLGVKRCRS